MPDQFTDFSGNDRHMVITNSGDWTTHAADLPNGEASHSLSTTLNENARYDGSEAFTFTNGAGTEATTVVAWVKISNVANNRGIFAVRTNGTATTTTNRHWDIYIDSSEQVVARWHNTTAGLYLFAQGTTDLTAGWHMIAVIFRHGSTRSITVKIDGSTTEATSGATNNTATYGTSDTYVQYLGAFRTDAITEMTDHMAEVAIFPVALTDGELDDLYDAMVTP